MKKIEEIERIRKETLKEMRAEGKLDTRVIVGMGTCGIASGAKELFEALIKEVKQRELDNINITKTGCIGICYLEPIIEVIQSNSKTTYIKMTPKKLVRVLEEHLVNGRVVEEFTISSNLNSISELDFLKKQYRIALRNCGVIDPENINEYLAQDGYRAAYKTLSEMIPRDVIAIIKESGLRGRGGGGFPTGLKWESAANQESNQKYIICNADEGDPGAFMDRSVLEGDPHSVLESMIIAGYAIGASQGYIYVRAEYPVAVKRLTIAINQAKDYGLLGENIMGLGFDFAIEIRLGAGAFVCGEETALMNSIEGNRGVPNPKPPFPTIRGLFNMPTVINNVETFANISPIILKGARWFSSIGTDKSKGTKVFALGGKIRNTGLIEVPMGITLKEIIYEIGGGIPSGKKFKAVQTGGPSGGCITADFLDTPIDYDSLMALGSMMGSGGMIIMDQDNCMVDVARFYLDFIKDESCGKCTPCRIGTSRLLELLKKITSGQGTIEDLDLLQHLSDQIKISSLCGLGQTAPNPVISTLKYFRNEYEAHVLDKHCPSRTCKSLTQYFIVDELCKGCGLCTKLCPVNAISGDLKKPHIINLEICIKCGSCVDNCRFNAIAIS